MKLNVRDHGDPSVGIQSQTWEVDVPFNKEDVDDVELIWFKTWIKNTYKEYAQGKLDAWYDFELKKIEENMM